MSSDTGDKHAEQNQKEELTSTTRSNSLPQLWCVLFANKTGQCNSNVLFSSLEDTLEGLLVWIPPEDQHRLVKLDRNINGHHGIIHQDSELPAPASSSKPAYDLRDAVELLELEPLLDTERRASKLVPVGDSPPPKEPQGAPHGLVRFLCFAKQKPLSQHF